MPYWYYDKKELRNTPSIIDGIEFDTENRYRKEGARFIIDCGTKMDLGYNTMATGVVYFHRFYMFHSFRTFPRYVTACCCLFLAGKVEETPKKCKDIIKTARSLLTDQKFLQFGEDPKVQTEEVMTLERILLQTIKFDLQVEHPYSYLLRYAKALHGDKAKLQKMVQMAWTFVNDSLCTTLSLQWEPEVLAVALMYLAGKLSKFEVENWVGRTHKHLRWWDVFVEDVTMDLLEDICHQVLDLYSQPQTPHSALSPPHFPSSLTPSMPPSLAIKSLTSTPVTPTVGVTGTPPVVAAKRPASANASAASAIPVKVSKISDTQKAATKAEEGETAAAAPPLVMAPVGPPPAIYPPHPPHHGPYPPPGIPQQPPPQPYQAYPYAMPHQPPTAPGQQPYFIPPY